MRSHLNAAILALGLAAVVAAPASAQYLTFPRLGVSAAPDHYEPEIQVDGDQEFQLYVLVLAPQDETPLTTSFSSFNWAVLQSCCGYDTELVDESYEDGFTHTGTALGGVVCDADGCRGGDYVRLATLTFRMITNYPGDYFMMCGPVTYQQACDGSNVVFTDLNVVIHYTVDGQTPVENQSWGAVKALFAR